MPIGNNILAGASGQATGYDIDQSLRFDDGSSPYLSKTFAGAGNQRTFTFSGWYKKCTTGASQIIISTIPDSDHRFYLYFSATGQIAVYGQTGGGANQINLVSTPLYRDPSAWYHIVLAVDTTQVVAANRLKVYVNGEQVTVWTTETYCALNYQCEINSTDPMLLGTYADGLYSFLDGYLAEVHFIDGQALTPASFGETNSATNQWVPIEVTGMTYGTNGFYQKYSSTELANSFEDSAEGGFIPAVRGV